MPSNSEYNYKEPSWVSQFLQADIARKLSSADRADLNKKRNAIKMTPVEMASNLRTELDPANLLSLDKALSEATDPEIIKILQDEKTNVLRLVEEANKIKESQAAQKSQETSFMDTVVNLLQSIFTKGN